MQLRNRNISDSENAKEVKIVEQNVRKSNRIKTHTPVYNEQTITVHVVLDKGKTEPSLVDARYKTRSRTRTHA